MTQYLKCNACGFIIDEKKLGDVCPVCGVKRQAFNPLDDKVSEKRRKLLNLHLHPIMTHFPNGFSTFSVALIIFTLLFPTFFQNEIWNTIQILSMILPLVVVITMLVGMYDGKLRFKSLNKLYLKQKIVISLVFIVLSIIISIMGLMIGVNSSNLFFYLILWMGCLLCGGLLGKIGGTLLCSKLPG